jgi:prophage antirepressor-like protein
MNSLIKLEFERKEIRAVSQEDKLCFSAKDVCDILGIKKDRDAMSRLDADERVSIIVDTLGGKQSINAVNESGLYGLIFQSRKPEAQRFRKWVTSEVLPSIRQNGAYIKPVITLEQYNNLQNQLHNLKIEADHYKLAYEREAKNADEWMAKSTYGSRSPANGLARLWKRCGCWVALRSGRTNVVPDLHQQTFSFMNSLIN